MFGEGGRAGGERRVCRRERRERPGREGKMDLELDVVEVET